MGCRGRRLGCDNQHPEVAALNTPELAESALVQKTESGSAPRLHLKFLDGVRGLAALYVAIYHCHMIAGNPQVGGPGVKHGAWSAWMNFGHTSVCVFIVLSGFVLMLPCIGSGRVELKGGFWTFIKRRFRRIFPPYWAALFFSLLVVYLGRRLHLHSAPNSLTPGAIWSHVFMVHNFWKAWAEKIDGPLWSVATEWDIYLVFALVLMPIVVRYGHVINLLFAVVIGLVCHFLFPGLDQACPWFIGLFAMGMSAAVICNNQNGIALGTNYGNLCGALSIIFSCIVLILNSSIFPPQSVLHRNFVVDIWVGLAMMCFIMYCILKKQSSPNLLPVRILENPYIVKLGAFSYSFYLIHQVLLYGVDVILRKRLTGDAELIGLLASLPLLLAISYLFYCLFERRFVSTYKPNAAKS